MKSFLLLICAALFLSPQVFAGERESLKIVAYNIKHGRGMDGKVDLKRIAKVIAKEKPDLVALQEVDKVCERSGKVDQAVELGKLLKMESRFGKFMDFQGGEYGLAVLSRFPITKSVRHQLPEGAEPRCALEIQVVVPQFDQPVSFVSIHNDWTNEGVRIKQINSLLTALKKTDHPVILAGDFNAKPQDQSLDPFSKEPWKILKKEGDRLTCPSIEPRAEIDYFIVKGLPDAKITHRVIEEKEASDHRPIVATIQPVSDTDESPSE